MENEELITILSYINYGFKNKSITKFLGLFKRIDRITCRIKNKTALTDFLYKLEDNENQKKSFLEEINNTNIMINIFGEILSDNPNNETLNVFFNLKGAVSFKKSFQDFYIVWLVLNSFDITNIKDKKEKVKTDILSLLKMLRNVNQETMDDVYFNKFISTLNNICKTEFETI